MAQAQADVSGNPSTERRGTSPEQPGEGAVQRLGRRHRAVLRRRGARLLVSFEPLERLSGRDGGALPPLYQLAEREGWSHLALLCDGDTWFRFGRVWRYFDRLIDADFFTEFDEVLFFGAGPACGHAACVFSVAAPGARVVAIRPVATLDPACAGWDRRAPSARRFDFTSRYGYGPDLIAAAEKVFLLHDPEIDEDAMHAALYRRDFVTRLDCRHLGAVPEAQLETMGLLAPLLSAAFEGRLTPALWASLWRARRDNPVWLRNVAARLAEGPGRIREAVFLRAATESDAAPARLVRQYTELLAQLQASGAALPPRKP